MPDFAALPPWAAPLFVIVAAIAFVVVRSGILEGLRKPPAQRQDAGEIVALAMDSRAIDKLTGEVAGLTIASMEGSAALREYAKAVQEQASQTGRLVEELHETNREMRELTREVAKARP